MRTLFFLLPGLLLANALSAQPKTKPVFTSSQNNNQPKTIRGTGVEHLSSWAGAICVSPDGRTIAISQGGLTLIDVVSGTMRSTPGKLGSFPVTIVIFLVMAVAVFRKQGQVNLPVGSGALRLWAHLLIRRNESSLPTTMYLI